MNQCEDMTEEEVRQLSWMKLSLIADHMGLLCVRSSNSDIARRRRYRGCIFAQWDLANRSEPDVEMDYPYEEEVRKAMDSAFSIAELRRLGVKIVMAIMTNESLEDINSLDWLEEAERAFMEYAPQFASVKMLRQLV